MPMHGPSVVPALSTRHRGEIAQLKICLAATERGYCCSRPIIEGCRYDLIVDDGERLHRVQVKYIHALQNGAVEIVLNKCSSGSSLLRTYSSREIDAVMVYVAELDKVLYVPIRCCDGKTSLSLRVHAPVNNQRKCVLRYEDFVW